MIEYQTNYEEEFNKAIDDVRKLKARPTNQELLSLYGLYKQSTEGNNESKKPSVLKIKDNAKWNEWTSNMNKPTNIAKKEYVRLVAKLQLTYGSK